MGVGEIGKISTEEIIEIAKRQKQILWMILICIGANIASRIFHMPLLVIFIAVFQIYFVFKFAKSVGAMALLYILLLFIPLLGLIGLFVLNEKANKILKAYGLKVGFMGVPSSELSRLHKSE